MNPGLVIGLPRCEPRYGYPEGVSEQEWLVLYAEAKQRHGDFASGLAEHFRSMLADDLLPEGEAVSIAHTAIWEMASKKLFGRVHDKERAYLVTIVYRKTIAEFKDELEHARPQVVAARKYAKDLAKLEHRIAKKPKAGSPMSDEEEAEARRKLEQELALALHREYPEDDASAAVASPTRALADRVVGEIAMKDMVDKILAHPWMKENSRQRYVFLMMLLHEGDDIPAQVWTAMGWNPASCKVLKNDVKKWIPKTFPEFKALAS